MTGHDDFEPNLSPSEHAELDELAHRLVVDRPVPAPAFRGDLRRRLVADRASRRTARRQAVACLATGVSLLSIAALGVADLGPLAPTPLSPPDLTALLPAGP